MQKERNLKIYSETMVRLTFFNILSFLFFECLIQRETGNTINKILTLKQVLYFDPLCVKILIREIREKQT